MIIFKKTPKINFISISKYTVYISLLLIVIGTFSLLYKGVDLSIDFKGGTIINLEIFQTDFELSDLRDQVNKTLPGQVNIVESSLLQLNF